MRSSGAEIKSSSINTGVGIGNHTLLAYGAGQPVDITLVSDKHCKGHVYEEYYSYEPQLPPKYRHFLQRISQER